MKGKVSILVVGIGGYGSKYLECLLNYQNKEDIHIAGLISRNYKVSPFAKQIEELNIPVFTSLEEFYKTNQADLAIISSPIYLHKEQAIVALLSGSNVLCEKPTAGCVKDAEEMMETAKKMNKFLAIGYQWSFSDVILELKKDIISGVFGAPKRFKGMNLMPRPVSYFSSREWAGKKYTKEGTCIMDSVISNAASHQLHNIFFVLGNNMDTAATPKQIDFKLYRANDIETFDTAKLHITTEQGVEIIFCASHSVEKRCITFEYELENATVRFDEETPITAYLKDGTQKVYGTPNSFDEKVIKTIEFIKSGEGILPCVAETADAHLKVMDVLNEEIDHAICFSQDKMMFQEINGEKYLYVKGLSEALCNFYKKGVF